MCIVKKQILTQIFFVIGVITLWEVIYYLKVFPELMFPSVQEIANSVIVGFSIQEMGKNILYSLRLLIEGLGIGVILALFFSALSVTFKTIYYIYNMIVSLFDLIPGVALIPLAILWVGIGEETIIFIVVHSVIWPMSRSLIDGFNSIPRIYIEAGKNMGLGKLGMLSKVYIPASFSQMLSGIRVGWARAWRGLISAEMIFGTTSSGAGIGWFIFLKRNNLDISGVISALIVIIVIGIIVEYGIFNTIEKNTVRKWGMVR